MEIKNTTILDEKILMDYVRFSTFKGRNPKVKRTLNQIVYFLVLIVLLAEIIFFLSVDDMKPLYFLIPLFLLILYILIHINIINPSIAKKNNKRVLGSKGEYIFRDDHLFLKAEMPEAKSEETINYSLFHTVFETKGYIYLYFNQRMGYIIDKSKFENDDALKVREAISSNIPAKKYIVCKQ